MRRIIMGRIMARNHLNSQHCSSRPSKSNPIALWSTRKNPPNKTHFLRNKKTRKKKKWGKKTTTGITKAIIIQVANQFQQIRREKLLSLKVLKLHTHRADTASKEVTKKKPQRKISNFDDVAFYYILKKRWFVLSDSSILCKRNVW